MAGKGFYAVVKKRTKKLRSRIHERRGRRQEKKKTKTKTKNGKDRTSSTTSTDESSSYGDGVLSDKEQEFVSSVLENNRRVAAQSFANAYVAPSEAHVSAGGPLLTSLVEDILYIVEIHLEILEDLLQFHHGRAEEEEEEEEEGRGEDHDPTTTSRSKPTKNVFSKEQQEAIVLDGVLSIFRPLTTEQTAYSRLWFATAAPTASLEDCCAVANDFMCIANRMEGVVERLLKTYPHLESSCTSSSSSSTRSSESPSLDLPNTLPGIMSVDQLFRREANALISCFTQNAVLAAQHAHVCCMELAMIHSHVAPLLFGFEWERLYEDNQIMSHMVTENLQEMVCQVEDYLLNDFLFQKFLLSLSKAMVGFYLERLAWKSNNSNGHAAAAAQKAILREGVEDDHFSTPIVVLNTKELSSFTERKKEDGTSTNNNINNTIKKPLYYNHRRFVKVPRALGRIQRDVQIVKDFFQGWTQGRPGHVARWVQQELRLLTIVYGYMSYVNDYDNRSKRTTTKTTDLDDLILSFHRLARMEYDYTRYFLSDIFHLVKPSMMSWYRFQKVWKHLDPQLKVVSHQHRDEEEMKRLEDPDGRRRRRPVNSFVPVLCTESMLSGYYEDRVWQEKHGCAGLNLCLQLMDIPQPETTLKPPPSLVVWNRRHSF